MSQRGLTWPQLGSVGTRSQSKQPPEVGGIGWNADCPWKCFSDKDLSDQIRKDSNYKAWSVIDKFNQQTWNCKMCQATPVYLNQNIKTFTWLVRSWMLTHTHTHKVISNSPRRPNQTSSIPHCLDPLVGIGVEELLMFANLSTATTTIQVHPQPGTKQPKRKRILAVPCCSPANT